MQSFDPPKTGPKILFYDIETTNLNANFGYCLCVGFKWLGKKQVYIPSIADYGLYKKDPTNDKMLMKETAKILNGADIIVGHYSSRFDLPYINSRLLFHGEKPVAPIPQIDTWRVSRYQLKLNNNRLASIAGFFGLDDKTPVTGPHWIKAMAGNKNSLRYVIDHCKKDVEVLEQTYYKLLPVIPKHPNVNLVDEVTGSCPRCGASNVVKRGFSIAQTRRTQRYQCNSCGGWSRGKTQGIPGIEIR